MKTSRELVHEFVEYVPDVLKDGTVYVSIPFSTVIHRCCCGCGSQVVTPLSPTDWKLTFDGESITLYPSIGNWSFECQSHYWIENNRVIWAEHWSEGRIAAARASERAAKEEQFRDAPSETAIPEAPAASEASGRALKTRGWRRFLKWW
jgi:hypothetical protein